MAGDIAKRVVRHKGDRGSKYVQKYNVHRLVYFEKVDSYQEACDREKQLKHYNRSWKIRLIEKFNPTWEDLSVKPINLKNLDPRQNTKGATSEDLRCATGGEIKGNSNMHIL